MSFNDSDLQSLDLGYNEEMSSPTQSVSEEELDPVEADKLKAIRKLMAEKQKLQAEVNLLNESKLLASLLKSAHAHNNNSFGSPLGSPRIHTRPNSDFNHEGGIHLPNINLSPTAILRACLGRRWTMPRLFSRRQSWFQLCFYLFVFLYLYLFLISARNGQLLPGAADKYGDELDSSEVKSRTRQEDTGILGGLMSAMSNKISGVGETIHVAIASCSGPGEEEFHMREARNFLKSILLFNPNNIHLHIFATPTNKAFLRRMLNVWKRDTYLNFEASYYDTIFPNVTFKAPVFKKDGQKVEEEVSWNNLFRPCSSQRIFIPWGVKPLEKVIYMDADLLVLGPLDDLWKQFDNFDEQQFLGLAPIAFHHISFTLKRKIPTVGKYGHNAGVALMHADRIRKRDWREELFQLGVKIRETVNVLGDQDMINYYMHNNPEGFYEISCKYNYRREYCAPYRGEAQECLDARDGGTVVLHGVADSFISNETIFRYIFQVFERFEFGMSIEKDILDLLKFVFVMFEEEKCGNVGDIMYRKMTEYLTQYSSVDVVGKIPSDNSLKNRPLFSR